MKKDLSVILPCYNVPNLVDNLIEVIEVVKNITNNYEIIIIDDGNDIFPSIKQSNNIKIITHNTNKGKGESIMVGFRVAKGEIIAFIDADLQIPATLISSYYKIMKGGRSPNILIGSKRHHNSRIEYPFLRRFYSFGFQTLKKYMFNLKILNSQAGIKFFRKKILKDILPSLSIKRFAIDLEILVSANIKGYKIIEAPVIVKEKFKSTINLKAVLFMLLDTFAIFYRAKFKKQYERR